MMGPHVPRRALAHISFFLLVLLTVAQSGAKAQHPAPPALRAALEGTWQLEEWHVNGQVLRPPEADGRWSNRDGVVLFLLHRNNTETAESTMGYGVYQMDAEIWAYRYLHMETATGPPAGPAQVSVSRPSPNMRTFKVSQTGSKVVLEGVGGDRREYEGPFFTFFQKGQIVRRWRRVS
jgi:hypothetical protein